MTTLERRTPAAGGPGSIGERHGNDAQVHHTAPDARAIAEALNGRYLGEGRWSIRVPGREDRNPSGIIHDTGDGIVLYDYSGLCSPAEMRDALREMGLWPERRQSRSRGPSPRQLRREAVHHAVAGTVPERVPPFTRSIPRVGQVLILTGGDTWAARRRIGTGIILPPEHPPAAYRWPVRGRSVSIIDLTYPPEPGIGYDHPMTEGWCEDWRLCPVCWSAERWDWLQAWARLLLDRDGARRVRVVSSVSRPEPEEVRHAA